ncbi:DUF1958 domain-containing protein [Streptococcus sp. DD10]|uniref:DUF1958 domain-containing protein n=1 Tax=Streptococcus sp. DD10 TaxID=1777878 RepID=UPI003FA69B94
MYLIGIYSIIFSCLLQPSLVSADELMDITRAAGYTDVQEINRPKSSILIDGNTGDVLWQDNADEIRDPASMSKVMTLYLVFEAIHQGKISEDTVITATPADQATAKIYEISNNKIIAGVDYTVSELITMTAVPSSNATTIMLANYLSNYDPDAWLDSMNQKAQELGMTNTQWFNASGAAAVAFKGYYNPQRYDNYSSNKTTARDLAILTYNFVKNYPGILNYTNKPVVTVKAGTPYEETFETYNYSLPGAKYGIEGVDGLKTGSSPEGAFNYIATIKRGEQRMIAIIMGVGDWSDQDGEYYRHPFGNALIEKMYSDYEYKKLLTAGEHTINGKKYKLNKDFYGVVKKDQPVGFSVEGNQLKVENNLETVSPLISNSQEVEEVKGIFDFGGDKTADSSASSVSSTSKTESSQVTFSPIWFVCLLPAGILFLIIWLEGRRRSRLRQK